VSPNVTAPTLWNYDVCGQYPGEVGDGAYRLSPVQLQRATSQISHRAVAFKHPLSELLRDQRLHTQYVVSTNALAIHVDYK